MDDVIKAHAAKWPRTAIADYDKLEQAWQQIRARFPRVFQERDLGTFVEPGWWPTIISTCEQLTALLDQHPEVVVHTAQLKEKFGGLRWYVDIKGPAPDEVYCQIRELLKQANVSTSKICEVCGEPGELRHGGWSKTLCNEHDRKRR
jgi:hypothetical protein